MRIFVVSKDRDCEIGQDLWWQFCHEREYPMESDFPCKVSQQKIGDFIRQRKPFSSRK